MKLTADNREHAKLGLYTNALYDFGHFTILFLSNNLVQLAFHVHIWKQFSADVWVHAAIRCDCDARTITTTSQLAANSDAPEIALSMSKHVQIYNTFTHWLSLDVWTRLKANMMPSSVKGRSWLQQNQRVALITRLVCSFAANCQYEFAFVLSRHETSQS